MIQKRKGQITLESLLLYGVAILVVLLAVGALTYFGVLDLGRLLPDRCNLSSAGTLSCDEWSVTSDSVNLGISNVGARSLSVFSAEFTPDGGEDACTLEGATEEDWEGIQIRSGQIGELAFNCGDDVIVEAAGQKVRGDLVIVFEFDDGVIENRVGGQLIATVT